MDPSRSSDRGSSPAYYFGQFFLKSACPPTLFVYTNGVVSIFFGCLLSYSVMRPVLDPRGSQPGVTPSRSFFIGRSGEGGATDACAPPLDPNFFNFMTFWGKIGNNNRLEPPPLQLAHTPLGNPGCATEFPFSSKLFVRLAPKSLG